MRAAATARTIAGDWLWLPRASRWPGPTCWNNSYRKSAAAPARALVLGQAVQARLMVGQAEEAARDATLGLTLSPDDIDLMIMRASAEGMMERFRMRRTT